MFPWTEWQSKFRMISVLGWELLYVYVNFFRDKLVCMSDRRE